MKITVRSLDIQTAPFRVPFKFGAAVIDSLSVPLVRLQVTTPQGTAEGIGCMPLGNAWSFPGVPYEASLGFMEDLTRAMATAADGLEGPDDIWAMSALLRDVALEQTRAVAQRHTLELPVPRLCSLVTYSPWDLALFDAWGKAAGQNTYDLLRGMPAPGAATPGQGLFNFAPLSDVLSAAPSEQLAIFHAVGGLDPLTPGEVTKSAGDDLPDDLQEWIRRERLTHFKIKMQGKDAEWDYQRVLAVHGAVNEQFARDGRDASAIVYSLDMNEQCPSGDVLLGLLERLRADAPAAFERIAFVEQPTTRNLTAAADQQVGAAARLKPVVIDEGLVDEEALARALECGYNGVCLKTCKGFGFSVQMASIARAHGLYLCVQDLTCPGISLLQSISLAARVGVEGLEANARQFCPAANTIAEELHPEATRLKDGAVSARGFDSPGLGI